MPHHPFRFGVNVYGANSRTEWIAKAQHIEALGDDTCFVADHCGTFPPITGMTAAASAQRVAIAGSGLVELPQYGLDRVAGMRLSSEPRLVVAGD